jgi:hypothetical protein
MKTPLKSSGKSKSPDKKATKSYKGQALLVLAAGFYVIAWTSNSAYHQNPYICGDNTVAFNNAFVYITIALLASIFGALLSDRGPGRYAVGPLLILASLVSGVYFFMSMVMICYRF